ncbi:probable glutathione S-transferase GSTU6 isoform X2 [Triticum urartu]|uniref:probable glutathione S-transferase GSTU6 isoform X2 n=1 Tax=Triticum urartu TaxID=4572 RepID=UPI00204333C4|nr:probable glutathione S-transferase GSTU6 isoform X2 [Triticum urartu]XP_048534098.1 probable glutathione S-transferase GSTU6 isoform X2 [Triticum urartu]
MALHGLALPNSQVVLSAACTRPPVTAGRPSRARFVFSSTTVNRKLIVSSSSINNPYTAAGGMEVAAGEDAHELKLLGTWRSPFAMRVRLALHFKGLGYEYQEEDLANKSDLLLASNPVKKEVPVLIHNGVPICESLAILEYIDEVYHGIGPSLLPADSYQRARARFWAAYIDNKLIAPWWKMFVGKTDKEQDEGTKQTLASVEMLEGALRECSKGKPFFGGDNVGYVDAVLGGMVAWMQGTKVLCGVELLHATKTPLLLAWMEHFGELEPAKLVLPDVDRLVEFAKMKRAQRTRI